MCQVDELYNCLAIPPNCRSDSDVAKLIELTTDLTFFNQLSSTVRAECCKAMTVVQIAKGVKIFDLGDPSTAFYIVLKGSVSVIVLKKKIGEDLLKGSGTVKVPPIEFYKETILNAGSSFGELGLLKGIARTAAVTCREASILALLTKTDFDRIISRLEETRLAQVVDFLKEIPIFRSWTKTSLSKASYGLTQKNYRMGESVFREKGPANFVYCILEGEFKLVKSIISTERKMNVSCLYGPRSQTSLHENFRKTLNVKQARSIKKFPVVVKTTGEVMGDIEAMEGTGYDTSCFCMSRRGVLIAIPRDVSAISGVLAVHQQPQFSQDYAGTVRDQQVKECFASQPSLRA